MTAQRNDEADPFEAAWANSQVIIMRNQQLNPEQIIGYCQENFINILPNTGPPAVHPVPLKSRQSPANEEMLKAIMRQLSIFLQLTIQNCVLTSDPKVKSQAIRILGEFRNLLSRDLDDFQNLIHLRNRTKLPFFEVDCHEFLSRDLVVKIPPQVSLYQDPLLFYNYSRLAQDELFCNLSIMKTREERIQILKSHVPFLNPNFIPIIGERLETKAKFSELEDRLLLIMLSLHSKRDIPNVKNIYFPTRQESTICNRAKNLCAKQMINPIKKMREDEYLPLSEEERKVIMRAYARLGPRWPVISKYYGIRSASMLEADFEGSPRLEKIRRIYNVQAEYGSIREIIERQMSRQMEGEQEEAESAGLEPEEQVWEMCTEEPCYKIINHLTFLYEEL